MRTRRISAIPALLVLAVLVSACGDRDPQPDDARLDPDTVGDTARGSAPSASGPSYAELRAMTCDTIDNTFRCARAIEARQIEAAPGVARLGDTLRLPLEGGDTTRLVDVTGPASDVRAYSYLDHWRETGLYLVHLQYYEGSRHLLMSDDSGERTDLPDWPLRSPDGRRFAVLSLDLEAGYGPNTLQVWALEDGEPTLEWAIEPEDWGPADGEWRDATTLGFTQRGRCEALPAGADDADGYMCERPAELRLDDGWRLDGGFPSEGGGDG